jgi:hypothetical protein
MTDRIPCSALLAGSTCKNGFMVTAACHGIDADHVRPTCMLEDRCWHMYGPNGGVPKVITDALSAQQAED